MSEFCGKVTPQGRAYLEPIMGKLAGPGMCNPDDETPCTKGTPSQEAIDADTRTLGQRQHDALITVARNALASGELGHHNGLPVTVVLGATAAELAEVGGQAVTAGGSRVPPARINGWCSPTSIGGARTRGAGSPPMGVRSTTEDKTSPRVGAPISINRYSRAGRITATSPRRVGRRLSTKTAGSNGSHPRSWTPAKPAPTSTTTGERIMGDKNPARTPRPDAPPGTAA